MRKDPDSKELVFEKHASQKVEDFFFKLANEALEHGFIDKELIDLSIKNKWIREDFYNKLK